MSASSPGRRARRALILLGLTCALVLGTGGGANAHPFGDPQTATIAADGEVVSVVWRVGAADDLTLLGVELGVLPEDRVMLDGAIDLVDGDAEAVAGSQELRAYLVDRIEVSAGGDGCAGSVVEVGDLVDDGARVEYTCPRAVDTARVTVRTLTDLHPAYRTLAKGPDGQRAVYESAADTHDWALRSGTGGAAGKDATKAPDDLGRSAALQLGAVLGVVFLILVAGALVLRRRSSSPSPSPTPRRS
jgi:hypothetical protein